MNSTNLSLFDRLVEETSKLASTPVNRIPLSKGRLKRWADLADYWEAHPNVFPALFYEAIFHIARGRYSKATTTKALLNLVEEAMLTDLDALGVWRERRGFSCAFARVIFGINGVPYSHQRWKSYAMRCFVEGRLQMLLMYRGRPIPQLNLKLIRNRKAYWGVRKQLEIHSTYTRFVECIELLVPDCHRWTFGQWANEKFIFSEIKAIHGIDFAQHVTDFDALFFLFKNKAEGFPYYKDLFSIKNSSVSIASAVLDSNMEREICKQFNIACTVKPKLRQNKFSKHDPIYPKNMAKSWAFQQLSSWYKTKPHLFTANAKSKLLHIALGEHPWNVTHNLPTAA